MGSTIDEIPFIDSWKQTLIDFKCNNVLVNYGEKYQLNWLKNLLLDRSYINVLHLKNNTLKHLHINTTKKKLHVEKSEKKMDIELYIKENISDAEVCIIHGISSSLKLLKDNKKTKILNGDKKDTDIIEAYEKVLSEKNSAELQWWLDRLLDPKEGKKIVFGIDIRTSIKHKLLNMLFCTTAIKEKILEKIPPEERIFMIIEIKSFGDDIGRKLENDFKGAVGIKFY